MRDERMQHAPIVVELHLQSKDSLGQFVRQCDAYEVMVLHTFIVRESYGNFYRLSQGLRYTLYIN